MVEAARSEVAKKAGYDPKYYAIAYPGGDVPGGGACTDLVVRALRAAGHDLQKLVHEDKRSDLNAYPRRWKRHAPDTSIDHRRVPNLVCFFRRRGQWLSTAVAGPRADWRPGDLVFWKLSARGPQHCGVISDRRGSSGLPMVIHNLGGAAEEDCLNRWKLIGHARYPRGAGPAAVAKTAGEQRPALADEDDVPKG